MSDIPLKLTFTDDGDFAAAHRAVSWLEECGFSIGKMQGRAPRGILFGLYDIQKWRNLSEADRAELHGILYGDMRNGPVTVKIFDTAPDDAKAAFSSIKPKEVA